MDGEPLRQLKAGLRVALTELQRLNQTLKDKQAELAKEEAELKKKQREPEQRRRIFPLGSTVRPYPVTEDPRTLGHLTISPAAPPDPELLTFWAADRTAIIQMGTSLDRFLRTLWFRSRTLFLRLVAVKLRRKTLT